MFVISGVGVNQSSRLEEGQTIEKHSSKMSSHEIQSVGVKFATGQQVTENASPKGEVVSAYGESKTEH